MCTVRISFGPDDATLSSLMLSGVTLMYKDDNDMDMTGFMSDVMAYTGNAASEMITVTATANHLGAKNGITVYDGATEATMADGGGYEITLGDKGTDTTVTVQVKPESIDLGDEEDGQLDAGDNDCTVVANSRHDDIECYTVTVTRAEDSMDASLTSLSLMDSDGMAIDLMPMFASDMMDYTATVASDVDMVTVSAMAIPGATVSGDGMHDLMEGENTITVTVTAEDGTTMMTYAVMVTREALSDDARLLAAYDMDSSGHIDLSEVNAAIDDYFDDILDLDEVGIVIDLYFS